MSAMEDTKEIEAWDAYRHRGGMLLNVHEIRSHRAPRVPSAFPIRRLLLVFMAVAMSAGFINTEVSTSRAQHKADASSPLSVPESLRWTEPRADRGQRVDTGSEVDTAVRVSNPGKSTRTAAVKKFVPPPVPPVERAIQYALAQVGKPYRWAQAGPKGYDCSGLVLAAFAQIGIKLPHYTGTMIGYGKKVSKGQLQRGDIIFPSSGHVAIYLGNGQQVAASSGKGRVVVQPVYAFYAARRLA